jgi:signal transduction histidine kinase
LGLVAAVRSHLKQVQEAREKPLLSLTTSEETWTMPEETALALLRIIQQVVQNALQHADAELIDVSLHYDKDCLRLEVTDDGRGFKRPYDRIAFARDGHLDVVGMAERAEAIHGNFEVSSQPEHGTSIRVTLPKPASNVGSSLKDKSSK